MNHLLPNHCLQHRQQQQQHHQQHQQQQQHHRHHQNISIYNFLNYIRISRSYVFIIITTDLNSTPHKSRQHHQQHKQHHQRSHHK